LINLLGFDNDVRSPKVLWAFFFSPSIESPSSTAPESFSSLFQTTEFLVTQTSGTT